MKHLASKILIASFSLTLILGFQNSDGNFEVSSEFGEGVFDSNSVLPTPTATPTVTPTATRTVTPPPGNGELITAAETPDEVGGWWQYFRGDIKSDPFYSPHEVDFGWSYATKLELPENARVNVFMHGSGGGLGVIKWAYAPDSGADIKVTNQDAETYRHREWWTCGYDGVSYPGRRIVGTLNFLKERYPQMDTDTRGLILSGSSMGGAGAVAQTMLLPEPWRSRIAYSRGRVGVIMARRIYQVNPGQYTNFPPDIPANKDIWDSFDFEIQAAIDPVVRGIHYRHHFGSHDSFSRGPDGNTQTEFVNIVEKNKISGAFSWVNAGHSASEPESNIPSLGLFEDPMQDVTLDRAHPAITNSTGNWPLTAAERIDEANFPRGHYNMGLIWDHANIIDQSTQIIFPLKYVRRTDLGIGLSDQPANITISVTPRRPRNFVLQHGETLNWSWGNGALSGTAVVNGDTVTIDNIPLVSGESLKMLRIYK